MRRETFLRELKSNLSKRLMKKEVDEAIAYYDEMIKDRIDAGEREEDIIASLGNISTIIQEITMDSIEKRPEPKNIKSIFGSFRSLVWIASTPVMIFFAVIFAVIIISVSIAFFSVVVAGFAALIGTLVSLVQSLLTLGEMNYSVMEYLFVIGMHTMVVGMLLAIFGILYQAGIFCLRAIVKVFRNLLKGRMVKNNVEESI